MIQEHDSLIVQTVSRFLIPLVQIYGLYVLIFGQFGPGGGFVAGVIIGASVILMVLVFGLEESHSGLAGKMLHGDGVGLLIYVGVGGLCLIGGGEFLNYAKLEIPGLDTPSRRFIGILLAQIGVAADVAVAAISIVYSLSQTHDAEAPHA